MISPANSGVIDRNGTMPFGRLVQQVFSLDSAIQWVVLEEAGREPRWAWRDSETRDLRVGTTMDNASFIDPLMLMLAEGQEAMIGDGGSVDFHQLRFIVLHYEDAAQIVARFGRYAHIGVAIAPGADAGVLGAKLIKLLNQFTRKHAPADIN
jgi:triphosphoribosyl-dephospho-CoA synthetase